jgi:hypothetical protein
MPLKLADGVQELAEQIEVYYKENKLPVSIQFRGKPEKIQCNIILIFYRRTSSDSRIRSLALLESSMALVLELRTLK